MTLYKTKNSSNEGGVQKSKAFYEIKGEVIVKFKI